MQGRDLCLAWLSFEAERRASGATLPARAEDPILDALRSYGIMHRAVAEAVPLPALAGKQHDDGHRQKLQVGIVSFLDSSGARHYNRWQATAACSARPRILNQTEEGASDVRKIGFCEGTKRHVCTAWMSTSQGPFFVR